MSDWVAASASGSVESVVSPSSAGWVVSGVSAGAVVSGGGAVVGRFLSAAAARGEDEGQDHRQRG